MGKFKIYFIGKETFSNCKEAFDLNISQNFGEKEPNKIYFFFEEAFYLFKKKKAVILNNKLKEMSEEEILNRFTKYDKYFQKRYSVYENLRDKGYVPKEGFKFGVDFRVYEKGDHKKVHSKWLCLCLSKEDKFSWTNFSSVNRIANTTKKELMIAFVDKQKEVTYYVFKWTKNL